MDIHEQADQVVKQATERDEALTLAEARAIICHAYATRPIESLIRSWAKFVRNNPGIDRVALS